MKLFFVFCIFFFYANFAACLPAYPGPQLHTFDTNKKSEDQLFIDRWQKNFGSKYSKSNPSAPRTPTPLTTEAPTLGSSLAEILAPVPKEPGAVSIFKDLIVPAAGGIIKGIAISPAVELGKNAETKTEIKGKKKGGKKGGKKSHPKGYKDPDLPQIPEGYQIFTNLNNDNPFAPSLETPIRPFMHGALNPDNVPSSAAPAGTKADWRDWVPLTAGVSAPVGVPVPEGEASEWKATFAAEKPKTWVMPPNTMTKAELLEKIIAGTEVASNDCPECGKGVKKNEGGLKSRFKAWLLRMWIKLYAALGGKLPAV